jgi:hypothetical protein
MYSAYRTFGADLILDVSIRIVCISSVKNLVSRIVWLARLIVRYACDEAKEEIPILLREEEVLAQGHRYKPTS